MNGNPFAKEGSSFRGKLMELCNNVTYLTCGYCPATEQALLRTVANSLPMMKQNRRFAYSLILLRSHVLKSWRSPC